jgi:hypothetical protein
MALRNITSFVAASCVCAASAIHADVSEPFEVEVRLRVDRSLTSRRITGQLKAEAEAIWGPYGVRLEWSDDGAAPESAGIGVSIDASLEREFERRLPTASPAVLGRVAATADASTWRSIGVSVDATESVLARRTPGRPVLGGMVPDPELARALGRVLAHEIGHVLLGPPYHDRAGLMRDAFRADQLGELDRRPFRLTCGGVDRLRNRLRALSRNPQRGHQHNSTRLDPEGFRGARSASSVAASCIPGH